MLQLFLLKDAARFLLTKYPKLHPVHFLLIKIDAAPLLLTKYQELHRALFSLTKRCGAFLIDKISKVLGKRCGAFLIDKISKIISITFLIDNSLIETLDILSIRTAPHLFDTVLKCDVFDPLMARFFCSLKK